MRHGSFNTDFAKLFKKLFKLKWIFNIPSYPVFKEEIHRNILILKIKKSYG